ncbi:unnamed protein product [Dovyalis caffra]|uniref:Uncharacterized protein n=1 Tax=Dovyalis caffra TaxID=77055 RepID=A0AAV1RK30_9ROSI|nr:unnamed protein product [Dovyalis caffra]
MDSWADRIHLARTINYQFLKFDSVQLSALIPSASEDAVNLIQVLCSRNPCNRPSAEEALIKKHPFFRSCFYILPPLRFDATVNGAILSTGTREGSQQKRDKRHRGALSNSTLNYYFPFPDYKLTMVISDIVQVQKDQFLDHHAYDASYPSSTPVDAPNNGCREND